MAKNAIIKFLTISEVKADSDNFASQLNLRKQEFYEAVYYLGLSSLRTAILGGYPLVILHEPASSCKRISIAQKKGK